MKLLAPGLHAYVVDLDGSTIGSQILSAFASVSGTVGYLV